ncbi:MAG: AMP-binding protein [Bacteroidota bacterium]
MMGYNQNNICSTWCMNALRNPEREAIVHYILDEEPVRWSYRELISTALALSEYLKDQGIKKEEVCAIIIRHNQYFYPVYLAVAFAGAIPAVLAYPNQRLHPEKFRQGLAGMSQRSGLDWILSEDELEEKLTPLISGQNSTVRGIIKPMQFFEKPQNYSARFEELVSGYMKNSTADGDAPFLLQHSSGTTGLQKPVILSNLAVIRHIENYALSIGLNDNDKVISWLPLYHDMGLIAAFHLPLLKGITSIQIDPFEWVVVPSVLFEAITKEKATLSWLPNFSYNMMSEKIRKDDLEPVDLSSLRLFINCSEPVRYESHAKFLNAFREFGITARNLSTCYAMAEATFAVTQTPWGEEARVIHVDRNALKAGKINIVSNGTDDPQVRKCVSSGRVIDGCRIKIVTESGDTADVMQTGEIAIRSESLFSGYRNYPEKTAEVLKDGWYYSGDLGFELDGYLYVIGRKKDIIIVAGNNIYPEDVEDTVNGIEGVIPGRVIAFGEDDPEMGSEQLSVIAETNITDETARKNLKMNIMRTCSLINVTVRNVYLVPPRWLIKSSSGKPSRSSNRDRLQELKQF